MAPRIRRRARTCCRPADDWVPVAPAKPALRLSLAFPRQAACEIAIRAVRAQRPLTVPNGTATSNGDGSLPC